MSTLDTSKPYGTIYGHDSAAFQQGGVLFDAAGEELDPDDGEVKDESGYDTAKAYVMEMLSGNPVSKEALEKEAGIRQINWADVRQVFTNLKLIEYKAGKAVLWKLPEGVRK